MDISLSDIEAFRAVARTGKVSAAARYLGLTQPTVSWTIKKLENSLGSELFQRTNKGMTLTRAGNTFFERSRELVRNFQSLSDTIASEATEIVGSYTLGVYQTLASLTLPRFIRKLLSDHPSLDLKLVHKLSREIAEGVINHQIDFGLIVNPPRHPDLTILELYRDEIKFWTRSEPDPMQDYSSETSMLIYHPGMRQGPGLIQEAASAGLILSGRSLHTTSLPLIHDLVAAGVGIGLLPETVARHGGGPLVPIPGTPIYHDTICLVYRPEARKTAAGKVIKETIVEALEGAYF